MVSELQALCGRLEALARHVDAKGDGLRGVARALKRDAEAIRAAAQGVRGPAGDAARRLVGTLLEAARDCERAAGALSHAAEAGVGYARRNAVGSGARGLPSTDDAPDSGSGFELADDTRYVHPGAQHEAYFRQLVELFGPDNPSGWISAGNPLYGRDFRWTKNCGPSARSFADTFQGVSSIPALGDSKDDPPGELQEMWDALGARPESRLTNTAANPEEFTQDAYRRLEAALAGEPPGTVAIIGVDWDLPDRERGKAGGHWFNAYIDHDGVVKWADEQQGRVAGWPPGYVTPIWQIEGVVRRSAFDEWKGIVL